MPYEFKMPDIGEGLHEAEVVRWFIKVGDMVKADEAIAEVQTDKAVVEMTSPVGGRVYSIIGDEGTVVKVGQTLITLVQGQGESLKPAAEKAVAKPQTISHTIEDQAVKRENPKRVIAAPTVRKLARTLGINITEVPGSAKGGRITIEDVENYGKTMSQQEPDKPSTISRPLSRPVNTNIEDERIPVRGLRKRIAEKMVQSKFTAPHVTGMDEINVTKLVDLQKQLNQQLDTGIKITYLPFIIKSVTRALKEQPYFNASFDENTNEIVLKKRYNIGIATATEAGLVVPVIKQADQKSIIEIAVELNELVQKARDQKLELSDIQDGTFTITSTGIGGGWFATPIINYPEVAIFGAHAIKRRPVVMGDDIVIGHTMGISLTFDHRVIDGEPSGRFMRTVTQFLENPELLLLDVK